MKRVLPIIIVLVALFLTASPASAYVGTGSFPPGYFDNPHVEQKLVCELVRKELPFGKEVYVPRCKVVKVTVPPTKNKDFSERINEFVTRIISGGK